MSRVEKKKVGYFLPQPLIEAVEEYQRVNVAHREKWLVIAAALVMFLEAGVEEQGEAIGRVGQASLPNGSFEDLLRKVQEKHESSLIRRVKKAPRKLRGFGAAEGQ